MIHLARHGQTAYNAEGRFQGHLPVPLDETGPRAGARARRGRRRRRGPHARVQPARRARARRPAIVAARIGLAPEEDARFTETDTGDWTDRSFAEIQRRGPRGLPPLRDLRPDLPLPRRRVVRRAVRPRAGRARATSAPAPPTCRRSSSATAACIRLALAVATGDHTDRRPRDRQRDAGDRVSRLAGVRLRRARARDVRRVLRRPAAQGDAVGRRRVPPQRRSSRRTATAASTARRCASRSASAAASSLAVVDADGDEVRELIDDDTFLPYREIRARWDGRDDDGRARARRRATATASRSPTRAARRDPGVGPPRHDAAARRA